MMRTAYAGAPAAGATAPQSAPSSLDLQYATNEVIKTRLLGATGAQAVGNERCIRCICDICTCGTHHCPPTPRRESLSYPPDLRSQAQASYVAYPGFVPTRSLKPTHDNVMPSAPLESTTSYATSYMAPPRGVGTQIAKPVPSTLSVFDRNEPLSSDTSYAQTIGDPARFARVPYHHHRAPPSNFVSEGVFDSTSSNRADYVHHHTRPAKPFIPANNLIAQEENRSFETENGIKFNHKGKPAMQVPVIIQSTLSLTAPDARFEGASETADRFVTLPYAKRPPCLPEARRTDQPDPRTYETEQNKQFQRSGAPGTYERHASPYVNQNSRSSYQTRDEPFLGESTTKADYVTHELPPRMSHAQSAAPGTLDADDRTWETESTIQYKSTNGAPRAAIVRPETHAFGQSRKDGEDDRDPRTYETTQRQAFDEKGYAARPPIIPAPMRRNEDATLPTGVSTHRAMYPAQPYCRREPLRPADPSRADNDDRSFVSETSAQYQYKPPPPCPSVSLEDRTWKDRPGHVYYEQRAEGWKRTSRRPF